MGNQKHLHTKAGTFKKINIYSGCSKSRSPLAKCLLVLSPTCFTIFPLIFCYFTFVLHLLYYPLWLLPQFPPQVLFFLLSPAGAKFSTGREKKRSGQSKGKMERWEFLGVVKKNFKKLSATKSTTNVSRVV